MSADQPPPSQSDIKSNPDIAGLGRDSTASRDAPAPAAESARDGGEAQEGAGLRLAVMPVALPALSSAMRCQVTLLFADLFGYSELTEEREIEQVAALVGEIKREAVEIVHAHGGVVNQFVGDEVMAIFGFPKADRAAPRRAVEAALALHALVRSVYRTHRPEQARSLCLHSGLDSGLVLVRTRDVRNGLFELTGRAVIRAARLRSLAGPDEVLVSGTVHAQVARHFHCERLEALRLKGSARWATPFRIVEPHVSPGQPTGAAQPRVFARGELTALQRFWSERAEQQGGLVIVRGTVGSGKSRLLTTFAEQLRHEGVPLWHTGGRDNDCEPFSAIARLAHAGGPHAGGKSWVRERVDEELASRKLELQREVNHTQVRGRAAEIVAARLCRELVAQGTRAAFFIDDLQWVDSTSLSVLLHVARHVCSQGGVVVCAVREDASTDQIVKRVLTTLQGAPSATIRLGPLSLADTNQLIAEHLGLEKLTGPELVERLSALSDRTPLSLVQLLNVLLDGRYLQSLDGELQLDRASFAQLRLTPHARGMIEHRVQELSTDAHRALEAAAIMRPRVELLRLAGVLELDLVEAERAVEELEAAHLLLRDNEGMLLFVHDLIWEVVAAAMSDAEERDWHRRCARALRAIPMSPRDRFTLARHCAAGLIEEDPVGSYEALWGAAQAALDAHDDGLALSFLLAAQQAAKLADAEPSSELFATLGETALRAGELRLAFESFEFAAACRPPGLGRAYLLGRMAWIRHFDSSGAPQEMFERALAECGEHTAHSSLHMAAESARRRMRRWVPGRRPQVPTRQAEVLCGLYIGLSRVCIDSGQVGRAFSAAMQLAVIADELPECRTRAQADAMVALFLALLHADSASARRMARSLSTATHRHDPVALAYYHQLSSVLAAHQGDFARADHHARECVVSRGQYVDLSELCLLCLGQYLIEFYHGRVEQALEWISLVCERAQQAGLAPAVFIMVQEVLQSQWVAKGRDAEVALLSERLRFVKRSSLGVSGLYHVMTLVPRVPYRCIGPEDDQLLDRLLLEFQRFGISPKRLPLWGCVFYVLVAHARLTRCLRSEPAQREYHARRLRSAVENVVKSERLPVMRGHSKVLTAALHWLEGKAHKKVEPLLLEAEGIARDLVVPWVSFTVARVRAFRLRAEGNLEAAQDQARIAALHARQYGHFAHLALIEEEFELD